MVRYPQKDALMIILIPNRRYPQKDRKMYSTSEHRYMGSLSIWLILYHVIVHYVACQFLWWEFLNCILDDNPVLAAPCPVHVPYHWINCPFCFETIFLILNGCEDSLADPSGVIYILPSQ